MLGAIADGLAPNHYDLLMAHVNPYDTAWVGEYLNTGRVDGFILMTSTRKPNHIKTLLQAGAPFIVWGLPMPNLSYCSVMGDNYTGGSLAGRHLVSRGRRRIAFLGGPAEELEVQKRFEGYAAALGEAGVDPLAELLAHPGDGHRILPIRVADLAELRQRHADVARVGHVVAERADALGEARDAQGARTHVDPPAIAAEIEWNADDQHLAHENKGSLAL